MNKIIKFFFVIEISPLYINFSLIEALDALLLAKNSKMIFKLNKEHYFYEIAALIQ